MATFLLPPRIQSTIPSTLVFLISHSPPPFSSSINILPPISFPLIAPFHPIKVTSLMESVACGHTVMEPETNYGATCQALDALTLAEVNAAAYELGAHALSWDDSSHNSHSRTPSALVACAPLYAGLTHAAVAQFYSEMREQPVTAPDLTDLIVPTSLLPPEKLPEGFNIPGPLPPAMIEAAFDTETEANTPGLGPASTNPLSGGGAENGASGFKGHEHGVIMRRLASGVALNYRASGDEPQRACLRLSVPGGRASEQKNTHKEGGKGEGMEDFWAPKQGAVALGARTMQEGGALGGLSRTQVRDEDDMRITKKEAE